MECLRLVLLHHGHNDRREYWTDQDGRLLLTRRRGDTVWRARVDREHLQVVREDGAVVDLQAETAGDLADLVVLEKGVQAVFDEEGHWREDVTGWPVRVERPRRPLRN